MDDRDKQLADALGLECAHGRWAAREHIRGTYLRYVWRLSATDGEIVGGFARLMVAGFEVSDNPEVWRPCSPRFRAAVVAWGGKPRVVVADLDADPVAGRIGAVRWCHLSPLSGLPPYCMQLDGQSLELSFWTAENCGVSIDVGFGSSFRRRSVTAIREAAGRLAERVARTSPDENFRTDIARCFPATVWTPTPEADQLRAYVGRVREGLAELLAAPDRDMQQHARDLWHAGVDDTTFAGLLPDYPAELAARVLPHLRALREDEEM